MIVRDLFQNLPVKENTLAPEGLVSGLTLDSREVKSGDLFVALQGNRENGLRFVEDATRRGAMGVISEQPLSSSNVAHVVLPELRTWLGILAARVYGEPSRKMTVVGITGTNGKTTITYLLEAIFQQAGFSSGVLGTINYRWHHAQESASHTTPEAPRLQKILRNMADDGVSHVVMECSSHALAYGRISNVQLDVALFTNFTQDHLDFHKTLEDYRAAKWKLFDEILRQSEKLSKGAIFNLDDPTGADWAKRCPVPVVTYSLHQAEATIHATDIRLSADHIEATICMPKHELHISSNLIGQHNLSNVLAAVAVGYQLGISPQHMERALNQKIVVPGRLESVANAQGISVFVDYAHTEDALENVLRTLKPLTSKRLLLVFGCGGDRDRGKRPKMMRAACAYADVVMVTSDNPRTENPEDILKDVLAGQSESHARVESSQLSSSSISSVSAMVSRQDAIEKILVTAQPGDVVLIAGKGHETYQEVHGVRKHFDDREVAQKCLEERTA